jgi:hypothetical protein
VNYNFPCHRYQQLTVCYQKALQGAGQIANGAQYFFRTIPGCYGEYAYVYLSSTSVYNLTLGNVSHGEYITPMLSQYIYELPPSEWVLVMFVFMAWL